MSQLISLDVLQDLLTHESGLTAEFRWCRFASDSFVFDYGQLREYVTAFAGDQGWCSYQSGDIAMTPDKISGKNRATIALEPPDNREYGYLLHGEITRTHSNQTLDIHFEKPGSWRVVLFEVDEDDEGEFLVDEVQMRATPETLGTLRYQRIWQPDDGGAGYLPMVTCFKGFHDGRSDDE